MAARGSDRIGDIIDELLTELSARLRGGRSKLSGQAHSVAHSVVDELQLVTRDDLDEVELRVAQLEHRLRLLEQRSDLPPP
jgi:BMFP domain-containing protein YqiC